MTVYEIGGEQVLANQQRHARIALAAMPVRVILREPALLRDLCRLGFQFLQAHHVRPLAPQPLPHLGRAGADAVHIPGGDFHAGRISLGTAPLIGRWLGQRTIRIAMPAERAYVPIMSPPAVLMTADELLRTHVP